MSKANFDWNNKIGDVLAAMKATNCCETTVHDPLQPHTSPPAPVQSPMPTDEQVILYLQRLIDERMEKRQNAGFWQALFSEDFTIEQSAVTIRDYIAAKTL